MIAGLPITGIGGVFYLLLALFMVPIELSRLVRGKSSVAAWKVIGRQLLCQLGVLITIGAQAALVTSLAPGVAEKGREAMGMTKVEAISQSQTAGLIAGSTLIALCTLGAVFLLVHGLRLYFQLRSGRLRVA